MVAATPPTLLTGWGRTMPSRAQLVPVASVEDVVTAVSSAGPRGLLARGAGRSYGDAAQNGGGVVLDLSAISDVELLDDGDVVAGAGVMLSDLVPLLLALWEKVVFRGRPASTQDLLGIKSGATLPWRQGGPRRAQVDPAQPMKRPPEPRTCIST